MFKTCVSQTLFSRRRTSAGAERQAAAYFSLFILGFAHCSISHKVFTEISAKASSPLRQADPVIKTGENTELGSFML